MPNQNKLLIWGDSILKGITFDRSSGRYAICRENSAKRLSQELGLEVVNHAKLGCTLPAGEPIIARDLAGELPAGRALVEFGGNDCDFDWDAVAADPCAAHQPKTPLPLFEAQLAELCQKLCACGVQPVLMTLPPIDDARYFIRICDGRDADNLRRFLGSTRRIYTWQERYSLAISRVAERIGCPIIEVRDRFLADWDFRTLLSDDGIHPNARGHAAIFECMAAFFGSAPQAANA